ncbi:hypothetical protein [Nocardioides zeicaulis]|uniref:Mce-associated membrane protein n=1 Tax=Nocardioides zeicaulis TaxID=1776857 RepID=A0ABV6DWC3_9ACTN
MRRACAVLGALVLVAAGVLGWLVLDRPEDGAADDLTSADQPAAYLVSAAVRDDVLQAADQAVTRVYGYSWRSLPEDRSAARALLTGRMAERYDRTMAGLAPDARSEHRVVEVTVPGSGVVHAAADYARVLVLVDRRTTARGRAEPRLDLDRVLVTLVRVDGAWRVSELDSL